MLCCFKQRRKNMIIGVDLDGVVFDVEEVFRVRSQIYDVEVVKSGLQHPEGIHVEDRFDWEEDVLRKFVKENIFEIEKSAQTKVGAKYVLDKLRENGHSLVCITARGTYFEEEKKITLKAIKKNKLKFDKLIWSGHDKLEQCKENNIQLMIEDNPNNVKRLAQNGVRCLYLRAAGIKKVNHKNVVEVQNWGDIYEKILLGEKIWKN